MLITVTPRREVKGKKIKYFAKVNTDPEFLVGTEIAYPKGGRMKGLYLTEKIGVTYNRAQYRANPKYRFWADFIYPSTQCETRGHFRWLNTYDRAYFTFGLLQFGAHVPRGDFVKLFRALLKTDQGKEYFPDLQSDAKGFINRRLADGRLIPLETIKSTKLMMEYLNPTRLEVELNEEVDRSARFIHWSDTYALHRDLQVDVGITGVQEKMKTYNKWYKLDGVLDKICLVIMDIHHQGRGTVKAVKKALTDGATPDAKLANLLKVGETKYPQRIVTLKAAIDELTGAIPDQPLGNYKYDQKKNDFVLI